MLFAPQSLSLYQSIYHFPSPPPSTTSYLFHHCLSYFMVSCKSFHLTKIILSSNHFFSSSPTHSLLSLVFFTSSIHSTFSFYITFPSPHQTLFLSLSLHHSSRFYTTLFSVSLPYPHLFYLHHCLSLHHDLSIYLSTTVLVLQNTV